MNIELWLRDWQTARTEKPELFNEIENLAFEISGSWPSSTDPQREEKLAGLFQGEKARRLLEKLNGLPTDYAPKEINPHSAIILALMICIRLIKPR